MATGSIFVAKLALPDEQSVAGGTSGFTSASSMALAFFQSCVGATVLTATASALNQTLVQLGGSFGLALTTVISASYQSRALSRGLEAIPALLEGIHAAFWLGAGFSFSAMFIGVVMLRGMGTIGKVKKDEKEEEKEDDSAEQGQGEGAREVRGDEKV
jgi:Na+-transporting methylmalonyl-CoA/oxaloacetate decarboxylase gamma subunit